MSDACRVGSLVVLIGLLLIAPRTVHCRYREAAFWFEDYGKGMKIARERGAPVILFFDLKTLKTGYELFGQLSGDPKISLPLEKLVRIRLDQPDLGVSRGQYSVHYYPTLVILDRYEREVGRLSFPQPDDQWKDELIAACERALEPLASLVTVDRPNPILCECGAGLSSDNGPGRASTGHGGCQYSSVRSTIQKAVRFAAAASAKSRGLVVSSAVRKARPTPALAKPFARGAANLGAARTPVARTRDLNLGGTVTGATAACVVGASVRKPASTTAVPVLAPQKSPTSQDGPGKRPAVSPAAKKSAMSVVPAAPVSVLIEDEVETDGDE